MLAPTHYSQFPLSSSVDIRVRSVHWRVQFKIPRLCLWAHMQNTWTPACGSSAFTWLLCHCLCLLTTFPKVQREQNQTRVLFFPSFTRTGAQWNGDMLWVYVALNLNWQTIWCFGAFTYMPLLLVFISYLSFYSYWHGGNFSSPCCQRIPQIID